MKLSQLSPGDTAAICKIGHLSLPQTVKRKLLSMGVTPHTHFKVVRKAPMGTGLELKLRGSTICMRKDLAEIIEVEIQHD
ncbi:FeoA family protein [Shewanella gaetbuli]|uniref:Ferrous iron transport protein A n=1 Tax=Shewanella gaetbuli TaxID=220752 RepID=A0A9X2CMG5_9GAMM|nr:FeoA family protein [Shewanella gaetbuli]MCL1143659.1 ferrous iron transport protein A [Shewanella gaetbuli]